MPRVWCRRFLPFVLAGYFFTLAVVVYKVYKSSNSVNIENWASYFVAFEQHQHEHRHHSLDGHQHGNHFHKLGDHNDAPPPSGTFDYSLKSTIPVRNISILMWTEYYHNKDLTDHIKNESPIPQWCNVTFDRSTLNRSDALVFHIPGSDIDMKDLPPRNPNVPWVYFIIEAPVYMQRDANEFNGLFNRTMSYRLDSDYSCPYGFLELLPKVVENPSKLASFPNKTKLVAWMVSHCATSSGRENFVNQMKKYIQIDIYGDCGTLTCDKSKEEECYAKLGDQYLFYLSFENSLCKDYITEKFSNALKNNLVPIVYGGGNYSAIVPYPKSFIDMSQYKSAKELTDYLKYLNENRTAYGEYFNWRKYYQVNIRQGFNAFKKLCYAAQRNETLRKNVYSNMHDWWTTEGQCREGPSFKWSD